MINRVLIRIKVIQILYSYLLVEKQFTLESSPTAPTKEKRFAYSLYLDTLVLLVKLAKKVEGDRGSRPLESTRFIQRIMADETVKAMIAKYGSAYPFAQIIEPLSQLVEESAIFKNYKKDLKKSFGAGEEDLWQNIFNIIVMQMPQLRSIAETRQNYTLKGMERMAGMMNRTFVNFLASQDNIKDVENALAEGLDKSRELYMQLLRLPVDITDLQTQILDDNRYKFLKTQEDVNPNLRFVENRLVRKLHGSAALNDWAESKQTETWMQEDPLIIRRLLNAVIESEVYKEYMEAESSDEERDCELWRNLFKRVILNNPDFLQFMEDKSVLWNDDLDIISTFVLKSFRSAGDSGNVVLDKFKDDEDARFGNELLRYVYRNKESYRDYITEALSSGRWESDRVAFMDMVILETALAEIMNFPSIPLSVSINEYIELAKSYSSARSGSFVNGVLATVVKRLQAEGKLHKK